MAKHYNEGPLCATSFIDLVIEKTLIEIEIKDFKKKVPSHISKYMMAMMDLTMNTANIEYNHFPEEDQEIAPEPYEITLDTWARSRINMRGDNLSFDAHTKKDAPDQGDVSPRTALSQSKISVQKDPRVVMNMWKENAHNFLTSMREEDIPIPVQLKQIYERPSTGEQKMRAVKERDLQKEKQKIKENKMKQENIEKEKKIFRSNKGMFTYDFEGKTLEVKPNNIQKPTSISTAVGTIIDPSQTLNEALQDKNLPRVKEIEKENIKLPTHGNLNAEGNKKIETTTNNPFELMEVKDGVLAKFGNKEKNNQKNSKKTIRLDNGVVRMSKEDYLSMVEHKGAQNQALSLNIPSGAPVGRKVPTQKEKTSTGASVEKEKQQKTEEQERLEKEKQEKNKFKSSILVKSAIKVGNMLVDDKYSFKKPTYSSLVGKKIEERRKENQATGQKGGPEMDDFNLQIMRSKFASEVGDQDGKKPAQNPFLRPTKSENQFKRSIHNKLADSNVVTGYVKLPTIKPRQKKLLGIKSRPKLSHMNVNIFDQIK